MKAKSSFLIRKAKPELIELFSLQAYFYFIFTFGLGYGSRPARHTLSSVSLVVSDPWTVPKSVYPTIIGHEFTEQG